MSTLVLRQIEQPGPGLARKRLELSGWARPMDEIDAGGSQRVQIEPIPGSPRASVRFDGPEEDEIALSFVWRGRLLGPRDAILDGVPVGSASLLVQIVDTMRQEQALVAMEWRGSTRVGVLTAFRPREALFEEYTPELTFRPVEPANYRPTVAPPTPRPRALLEQVASEFEGALSTAEEQVTFVRQTVDDAAQRVADVRTVLSRMRAVVDSGGLIDRDAGAVKRAVGETLQQGTEVTTAALTTLSMPYAALAQSDEPVAQLLARRWLDRHATAMRGLRRVAALERGRYRPESDILGIHNGSEGETVWLVAWLWYSDASDDAARVIARRNRLVASTIRAGQRLIIPRRSA